MMTHMTAGVGAGAPTHWSGPHNRRIAAPVPVPRRTDPGDATGTGAVDGGDDDGGLESLYRSSIGVTTRLLESQRQQQPLQERSDELRDWMSTVRTSLIRLTLSEPPPRHSDSSGARELERREGMMYSVRFVEALCTFARGGGDDDDGFDLSGVVDALEATLVDLGYLPPVDGDEVDVEGGRKRRRDALDTFLRAGGGDGDGGGANIEAWYREAALSRGDQSPDGDGDDAIADGGGRRSKRVKLSHRYRHRLCDDDDDDDDDDENAEEGEAREERRRMIRLGAMLSLPWVLMRGQRRDDDDDDRTSSTPAAAVPPSTGPPPSGASRKRKATPHPRSRPFSHGARADKDRSMENGNRRRRRHKWRSELLYVLSHFVSAYHGKSSSGADAGYRNVVVPSTRTFRDLLGLSAADGDAALACYSLDCLTMTPNGADFDGAGGSGVGPGVALGEVLRPGVLSELASFVRPPHGGDGDADADAADRRRRHGRHVALCAVARCLLGAGGGAAGRCAMKLWGGCGMDASSLLRRRMEGPSSLPSSSSRPPQRRRLRRSSGAAAAATSAAAPPGEADDETLWLVVRTELSILLSAGRTEEACLLANLASRGESGGGVGAMTTTTTPAADVGRESWGRIFEAVSSAAAAAARCDEDGDGRGCEEAALASLQDLLHVFPIGPVGQRLLLERLNADMEEAGQSGKPQLVRNIQKLMYCFLVARTDPISAFASAFDIDWWKLSLAATDAAFNVTEESLAFLLNDVGDGPTGAAAASITDEETPAREGGEEGQARSAPTGAPHPSEVAPAEVRVATSDEKSAVVKDAQAETVTDGAPHASIERIADAAKGSRAVPPIDGVVKKKANAAAALEIRHPVGDSQSKQTTDGEHKDTTARREQAHSTKLGDLVRGNRLREARREGGDDSVEVMSVDSSVGHSDAVEETVELKNDAIEERSEDEALQRFSSVQKDRGEIPRRREDTAQRDIEVEVKVEAAPEDISIGNNCSADENLNQEEEEKVEVQVVEEGELEEEVAIEEEVENEVEEEEVEEEDDDGNDDDDEEEEEEKEWQGSRVGYIDNANRGEDRGTEDDSDASSLQDEGDYSESSGSSDGSHSSGVESERQLSDGNDGNESVVVIDDDEDSEEHAKGMEDEKADDGTKSEGSRGSDASVASSSTRSSPAEEASPRSRDDYSGAEDDGANDEDAVEEAVDLSGIKVQEQRAVSVEQARLEQQRFEESGGVAAGETKEEGLFKLKEEEEEEQESAAVAQARLEQEIRKEEERVAAAKAEEEHLAKLKSAEEERELYVEGKEEERLEMLRVEAEERERAIAEQARLEQQRRDEEERLARLKEQEEQQERAAAEQARLEEDRCKEEKRAAAEKAEEERRADLKMEEEKRKRAEQERLKQEEEERLQMLRVEAEERERAAAEQARVEQQRRDEKERLARKEQEEQQERAAAEQARLEEERCKEEKRAAAEKAEEDRLAQLKLEEEKRKRAEQARLEQELREEEERLAAEKAEEERLAKLREKEKEQEQRVAAEKERLEQDRREEKERVAAAKVEAERLARLRDQKEEKDRVAAAQARVEEKRRKEEHVAAGEAEEEHLSNVFEQEERRERATAEQARKEEKLGGKEERLAAENAEKKGPAKLKEQEEQRERKAAEQARMQEEPREEEERLAAEKAQEERIAEMKERGEGGHEGDMAAATYGRLEQGRGAEVERERIAQKEEQQRITFALSKAEAFNKKAAEASSVASATKKAKEVDRRKETDSDDKKMAAHMKPKRKRQHDEFDGSKGGHTSNLGDPDVGAVAKASSPQEVLSPDSPKMPGPSPPSTGIIGTSITFDISRIASERLSLGTTTSISVGAPPVSNSGDDKRGIAMKPPDTETTKQSFEAVEEDTSVALSLSRLNAMKVAELRQECKKRGMDAMGHKADLLHRLLEETPTAQSVSGFSSKKVVDLRQECVRLGLDSTGKKSDLVARLEANSPVARNADSRKRLQEDSPVAASVSSFSSMRYDDLRKECRRLGLDSSGRKADLAARLEANSPVARKADPRKRLQEDGSVPESVSSFSSKVVELRKDCERLGLDSTGKKSDLVARLAAISSGAHKAEPRKTPQENSPVAGSVSSFSAKKVVELREDCKRLGLDSTGKKSDLVARLDASSYMAHKADPREGLQEESSVAESISSFSSKKVVDLRKDCKRLGLDSTGKKSDLVARLAANSSVARKADPREGLQEDSSVAESVSNFSSKKVVDLREDCKRLGLDSTGTKSDLVARLEENSSVAQSVSSFHSITVPELRGLCTRRGLDSTGRRADLVERLQEYSSAAQSHLDYESMTITDLHEECKYIGLDDKDLLSKGVLKADLLASLAEHAAKQPNAQKGHPKGVSKPPMPPSSRSLVKKRRVQTSSTSSAAAVKRLRSSSDADSTGNEGYRKPSAKPPLPPSSTGKAKTSKSGKSKGTPSSAGTVTTRRSPASTVRTIRSRTSKEM